MGSSAAAHVALFNYNQLLRSALPRPSASAYPPPGPELISLTRTGRQSITLTTTTATELPLSRKMTAQTLPHSRRGSGELANNAFAVLLLFLLLFSQSNQINSIPVGCLAAVGLLFFLSLNFGERRISERGEKKPSRRSIGLVGPIGLGNNWHITSFPFPWLLPLAAHP
jgi:hypothetical protein